MEAHGGALGATDESRLAMHARSTSAPRCAAGDLMVWIVRELRVSKTACVARMRGCVRPPGGWAVPPIPVDFSPLCAMSAATLSLTGAQEGKVAAVHPLVRGCACAGKPA